MKARVPITTTNSTKHSEKENEMRHVKKSTALLTALLLASLTACGQSSAPPPDTAATKAPVVAKVPESALVESGVLTISTNASQPPMQYVDNGKVVGMRVELGEKIAADLGLKPNIVNIDFASQIPGLTAGRWDMIDTGMYYSAQRAEQITMVPYEVSAIAVSVARGNPKKISSLDSLAGKSIAAEQGATEYQTLQKISDTLVAKGLAPINVTGFNDTASSYQALAAGQVQGVAAVQAVVQFYSKKGQFDTAIKDITPVAVALGFAKDNTVLASAVSKVLVQLKSSGWLDDLFKKYGLNPYAGAMEPTTGDIDLTAK